MGRVRGLDVSAAQGVIDFDRVPADFRFIVVKVSEGEGYKDQTRLRNMAEARRTGRHVMAYHFFKTLQDAAKQAENFWNALGDTCPIFAWLDFEVIADGLDPAVACERAVKTCEAIESYGLRSGVYDYPDHAKRIILPHAKGAAAPLGKRPLWMADYRKGEDPAPNASPYVCDPWSKWTMWQTSGNDSSLVPGIAWHVDHNVFNGDEAAFIAWLDLGKGEAEAPIVRPAIEFERKYNFEG